MSANMTSSLAIDGSSISHLVADYFLYVGVISSLVATYVFLQALLRLTQDAKEPELVSTSIPFLSPVFGMIRWSMDFYNHMK